MDSVHDLHTRRPALEIASRRTRLQESLQFFPGPLADVAAAHMTAAERAAGGLWRREPSVWSDNPAVQEKIATRLGWMSSPVLMADSLDRLQQFADAVKHDGFTDVVLLGMGGSSLAPEVLRAVLGVAPGWPRFQMIDSTDPAAVLAASTAPDRTLYVLASKSGSTIEPNSLAAHFRAAIEQAGVSAWARHFVAITDPGTALAERARVERFRETFINPPDIGGRYSALSFFGLVPAALMGHDLAALVGWGAAMLAAAEPGFGTATTNPAVALGLLLGAGALAGRDKLTLVLPPSLEALGLWIEQLVAESTGKQGVGVVPIAGETLARPETYGADRLFVRTRLHGAGADETRATKLGDLKAGFPVAAIDVPERSALAAEFVRWEIATAVAGALLRVNPFDEPNVQQAKDATRVLLDRHAADGKLPAPPPDRTSALGATLTLSTAAKRPLGTKPPESILTLLAEGDYLALLAYLGPDADIAAALHAFRMSVRDRTGAATMFGYGPRYLHSTGQLHKGGPNTGVFVLVTAAPRTDVPIPGEPFSFGTLELAQALGDFASLDAANRRAVHVHLPAPDPPLLGSMLDALLDALPRP